MDKHLKTLTSFVAMNLSNHYLEKIFALSGFQCAILNSKKKYHLLRETAILNLFIIHSVCRKKKISQEKINLIFAHVYKLKFKEKEDTQAWHSDLSKKIQGYETIISSEKAGGTFGIAGFFLLNLHNFFDNSFPKPTAQADITKYVAGLTEVVTKILEEAETQYFDQYLEKDIMSTPTIL